MMTGVLVVLGMYAAIVVAFHLYWWREDKPYRGNGLTLRERIGIAVRRWYHFWWACPRGHHYMKFSGCVYCGAQPERNVQWKS